jgi:aminopeptidase N
VGWLGTNSYKSELASVVLSALRDREDPTVLPALLRAVQQLSSQWTTQVQAKGLSTLAWLARHQENKSAVREFISEHVRHPKQSIRRAAIKALGDLGDDPSIPLLRTFAEASKTSPEQTDAEASLKAIRDKRRPAPELGDLRREVTDLQKENRELKQSVEALKQKFEAILPAKPATNAVPAEK